MSGERFNPEHLADAFAAALNQPASLGELLHPEATWWLPPSLGAQVQCGRDTIVAFRTGVHTEVFVPDSMQVEVQDSLVTDGRIALRAHVTATTPGGLPYDNDHVYIVHTPDGLIDMVYEYLDAAHAMAQLHPAGEAHEHAEIRRIAPHRIAVTTSIEIDAPHSQVWAVLTDFGSMPEWSSSFQGLVGDFRDGGQATATFRTMGLTQRFDHQLKFFEDGIQFGWSDPLPAGITDRHIYRVEPLLNSRSRLVQSDEFHGPGVRVLGKLLARQSKSAYPAFNRELKARAEHLHRDG